MQDYIGQCEEIRQKTVACCVFCLSFFAINLKMGSCLQGQVNGPLWLVQLQYMVPVTLKVGQKMPLMTLLRTHAHTERNPGHQDFTKTICVPKLCILWDNSKKRQAKHAAGHSLLPNLLTLTYIVLHAGLNVHLGALSVQP